MSSRLQWFGHIKPIKGYQMPKTIPEAKIWYKKEPGSDGLTKNECHWMYSHPLPVTFIHQTEIVIQKDCQQGQNKLGCSGTG